MCLPDSSVNEQTGKSWDKAVQRDTKQASAGKYDRVMIPIGIAYVAPSAP
jgi:hypothetical protein